MRKVIFAISVILGLGLGYGVSTGATIGYGVYKMMDVQCSMLDNLEKQKIVTDAQRKTIEQNTFKDDSFCQGMKKSGVIK